MSLTEVAEYLHVSRATVYRLIEDGRLAPVTPHNPLLKRQRPKFNLEEVRALRPDLP